MLISLEGIVKDYSLSIKGVIHIGAHFGEECADYEKFGVENILLFEPVKSNYIELLNHLPVGAHVYNIALGNETGKREMHIETANRGQSCSFLEPKLHLKQYPKIKFDTREEVWIDKLDNIDFDRSLYNMINIDIQGFEMEAFKGAEKTLEYIDIIYTEVNFDEVYKDCCQIQELDLYLMMKYGFERVLTDSRPRTWGDALYLKR
jgi:FkbM family methyltransferase